MRKTLVGAAAVIILAGLAYTAAWFYGASQLKQQISDWKQEAEAEGTVVSYDEIQIGGYPFGWTAALRNLTTRNEGRGMSLQAAPVRLQVKFWDPHRILYEFSGKYALTLTNEQPPALITLEVGSGTGATELDRDRRRDHGRATNLRFVVDKGIVTIDQIEVDGFTDAKPAGGGTNSFHLEYALTGLTASNRFGAELFQPPIGHMHLDADATGPFMDIFKNGTVVDWARAGGAFTLHDASLQWNGLTFSLAGNGSLDSELRPSGKLTVTSKGFEEGLQSLEDSGVLPPYLHEYIRQSTARFITPAGAGIQSKLLVAITAADGVLSVGGQPMAAVPSLNKL